MELGEIFLNKKLGLFRTGIQFSRVRLILGINL